MDLDRAMAPSAASGELTRRVRSGASFSVRRVRFRVVVGDVPLLRGETAAARTAPSEASAATSRGDVIVVTVLIV